MTSPRTPTSEPIVDEETVKMPRLPDAPPEETEFDPDRTVAREDWESTVIRRVAPRVAAVQSEFAEEPATDDRFGWESETVRRLAHEVRRNGG